MGSMKLSWASVISSAFKSRACLLLPKLRSCKNLGVISPLSVLFSTSREQNLNGQCLESQSMFQISKLMQCSLQHLECILVAAFKE